MSLSSIKVNNSTAININNQLKGDDQLISDNGVSKEFEKIYIGTKSENIQNITLYWDDIIYGNGYLRPNSPYEPENTGLYYNSTYIYIADIKDKQITFYGHLFYMLIFYYDRNKTFITTPSTPSYESPEVTKEITFTVPSNAWYIRFNLLDKDTYVKFSRYETKTIDAMGISIQLSQISDFDKLENGIVSSETQETTINGWDYNPQPGYITSKGTIGE